MQTSAKPQLCDVPIWVLEAAYGGDKKGEGYTLPKNLDESGRNTNLHRYTSKLRNSGLEWPEIRAAAHTVNSYRTKDALSDAEVDKIVENACKYENGESVNLQPDKQNFILSLGHNGQDYYYTSSSNRQIVCIPRGSHTEKSLMDLMPYDYWEQIFKRGKNGIDWNRAASHLMQESRKKGIFTYRNVRGRGCWNDKGQTILHLGSSIFDIQHKRTWELGRFTSNHIYALAETINPPDKSNITTDDTRALIEICNLPRWEKPFYGNLLSGWLAVARFCGALKWRPHIWITGSAGTGKSTIVSKIVRPMIGEIGVFCEGDTTDKGIQQKIKCDAVPVVFDEAETDDQRSGGRVRRVVELARQASSDNSAYTYKGTADGRGHEYKMSSMFCLSSIRVNLPQSADRRRFTILELKNGEESIQAKPGDRSDVVAPTKDDPLGGEGNFGEGLNVGKRGIREAGTGEISGNTTRKDERNEGTREGKDHTGRSKAVALRGVERISDGWEEKERRINEVMEPDFCEGVYGFMVENWETLQEGTKIFEKVINESMNRKAADQLGVILMGYWMLREGTVPSKEEAKREVDRIDEGWVDESSGVGNDDNVDCLDHLCQSVVKNRDGKDVSVTEMIRQARKDLGLLGGDGTNRALLCLHGMDVDDKFLYVANKHPKLNQVFEGSQWANGLWAKSLLRLLSAKKARRRINTPNAVHCIALKIAGVLHDSARKATVS